MRIVPIISQASYLFNTRFVLCWRYVSQPTQYDMQTFVAGFWELCAMQTLTFTETLPLKPVEELPSPDLWLSLIVNAVAWLHPYTNRLNVQFL